MVALSVGLILIVSLGVFAFGGNFGEAMLSLIGGLLTVFTVDWNVERFVVFTSAWTAFALLALLIASVRMAARTEDIYRQAAIRLCLTIDEVETIEKNLKRIAATSTLKMIDPIERAEIIRLLAFRRMPLELLLPCLAAVDTLGAITKCDNKTITIFVADLVQSFSPNSAEEAHQLVDVLYTSIKSCPVPPEEFFAAFSCSRRLLVSRSVQPHRYLAELSDCLSNGVTDVEMYTELKTRFGGDGSSK